MIEPAAYGAAVSFGPDTTNFRGVVAVLLDGDAAVVVRDGEELRAFVEKCLVNPSHAERLGQNARRIVLQQQGAVQRTMRLLVPLLNDGQTQTQPRHRAA